MDTKLIEPGSAPHGDGKVEAAHQPSIPFFPDFALLEVCAAFVFLIILLLVASLTKPTLETVADPNASGYVPRPEWYFLWFFQTLKYFKGKYEVLGTFLVPTVGIAALLSVPFIDRRVPNARPLIPGTRPIRKWPRLLGASMVGLILVLTFRAVTAPRPVLQQGPVLTPVQAAGKDLFEKMGCPSCHAIGGQGGARGPNLSSFGTKQNADQLVLLHFSGIGQEQGSIMPGYQLSPEELRSLAAYLLSLKGK